MSHTIAECDQNGYGQNDQKSLDYNGTGRTRRKTGSKQVVELRND